MVLLITHLNKLGCQFERRTLKAKVVSGGVGQNEPKVDVDDVSLRVQENVAIVSVCVCMHVSMSVCVHACEYECVCCTCVYAVHTI